MKTKNGQNVQYREIPGTGLYQPMQIQPIQQKPKPKQKAKVGKKNPGATVGIEWLLISIALNVILGFMVFSGK